MNTFLDETAFLVATGESFDEAENLVIGLNEGINKDTTPEHIEAFAKMMGAIRVGAMNTMTQRNVGIHGLRSTMQALVLRISLLDRIDPDHHLLPRLKEISEGYIGLHEPKN